MAHRSLYAAKLIAAFATWLFCEPAISQFNVPPVRGRCINCFPAPSQQPSQPSGPTQQQIEEDRVEAMSDANERGIDAFEKRDWLLAIHYFELALQFSPHSPSLEHNLQRAREELLKQQTTARSTGPQGVVPQIASDVRLGELAAIARSVANLVREYQNNPASITWGHRQDIEAALEILAARWIIYDREAVRAYQRAVVVQRAEERLKGLLEEVLEAVIAAMLLDVRRIKPFDWDTPTRAAEKRLVLEKTEREVLSLREIAVSELGDVRTFFREDSVQIEFRSGPALRDLQELYRGGRWRNL